MEWRELDVYEAGDRRSKAEKNRYFTERGIVGISACKIIQINETDIYVIGGHPFYPTLMSRDYDVAKSTLQISIRTGQMR
jgi:hypothetical protein